MSYKEQLNIYSKNITKEHSSAEFPSVHANDTAIVR